MIDKLDKGTIRWGYRFKSCEFDEDKATIHFENGASFNADLIVGADGLRSQVRAYRDRLIPVNKSKKIKLINTTSPNSTITAARKKEEYSSLENLTISSKVNYNINQLKYIGISVILGLSPIKHPLLTKGGFYVLDNVHCARLFTMPYQDEVGDFSTSVDASQKKSRLTMWQLSFAGLTEDEGLNLKNLNGDEQKRYAMTLVSSWIDVVKEMVQCTAPQDVWATPLYDRDPMTPRHCSDGTADPTHGRVTVIGDACHPMSMFKGQGANQALEDGPLLAKWILQGGGSRKNKRRVNSGLQVAICNFEREMVARTTRKVLDSFEASQRYHSSSSTDPDEYAIDGLPREVSAILIQNLNHLNIGANMNDMENIVIAESKKIQEQLQNDSN